MILLDPAAVQGQGHPLLGLAQRMTSVFQFRTPTEDVDQQYPSAFLANDRDGFLFRTLGSRWEGDWSPAHPAPITKSSGINAMPASTASRLLPSERARS